MIGWGHPIPRNRQCETKQRLRRRCYGNSRCAGAVGPSDPTYQADGGGDSPTMALSPTFSRMYASTSAAVHAAGTSSEGLAAADVVLGAQ